MGSVVVAHGLSCPVAGGIFPDQGSNPCPLHWGWGHGFHCATREAPRVTILMLDKVDFKTRKSEEKVLQNIYFAHRSAVLAGRSQRGWTSLPQRVSAVAVRGGDSSPLKGSCPLTGLAGDAGCWLRLWLGGEVELTDPIHSVFHRCIWLQGKRLKLLKEQWLKL